MKKSKTTLWNELKWYLDSFKDGEIITRKQIIDHLDNLGFVSHYLSGERHTNTIDSYRNYITQAGFLKTVSPGRYKKIMNIDQLTKADILRIAYKK